MLVVSHVNLLHSTYSLYVTVTNNKQINKLDLPMRLVLRLMGGYNG